MTLMCTRHQLTPAAAHSLCHHCLAPKRRRRKREVGAQEDKKAKQAHTRARLDKLRNRLIDREYSVFERRKVVVYKALVDWDEPVTKQELLDLMGWFPSELGAGGMEVLDSLILEGLVGTDPPSPRRRNQYTRYFADPDITLSLLPARYREQL